MTTLEILQPHMVKQRSHQLAIIKNIVGLAKKNRFSNLFGSKCQKLENWPDCKQLFACARIEWICYTCASFRPSENPHEGNYSMSDKRDKNRLICQTWLELPKIFEAKKLENYLTSNNFQFVTQQSFLINSEQN